MSARQPGRGPGTADGSGPGRTCAGGRGPGVRLCGCGAAGQREPAARGAPHGGGGGLHAARLRGVHGGQLLPLVSRGGGRCSRRRGQQGTWRWPRTGGGPLHRPLCRELAPPRPLRPSSPLLCRELAPAHFSSGPFRPQRAALRGRPAVRGVLQLRVQSQEPAGQGAGVFVAVTRRGEGGFASEELLSPSQTSSGRNSMASTRPSGVGGGRAGAYRPLGDWRAAGCNACGVSSPRRSGREALQLGVGPPRHPHIRHPHIRRCLGTQSWVTTVRAAGRGEGDGGAQAGRRGPQPAPPSDCKSRPCTAVARAPPHLSPASSYPTADYGDNVDKSLLSSGECLKTPNATAECAGRCCFSPQWQVRTRRRGGAADVAEARQTLRRLLSPLAAVWGSSRPTHLPAPTRPALWPSRSPARTPRRTRSSPRATPAGLPPWAPWSPSASGWGRRAAAAALTSSWCGEGGWG